MSNTSDVIVVPSRSAFNLLHASVWSLASSLGGLALTVACSVLLARGLGPSARGSYAVIVVIIGLATVATNLGISSTNAYYGAIRSRELSEIASGSLLVAALGGGAAAVALQIISVAPWFSAYLIRNDIPVHLFQIATLTILPSLVWGYLNNLLLSQGRIFQYNLPNFSYNGSQVVLLAVTLFVLHGGLWAGVWSLLLSTGFTALLMVYCVAGMTPLVRRVSVPLFKEMMRYGLSIHVGNIAQALAYRLDLLLVAWFLDPSAVGFYAVATGFAERLWMIPNVVATLILPRLAGEQSGVANELTARVTRHLTFLLLVMGLFFAALSRPLVVVLFGKPFEPATNAFLWLLPGAAAMGLSMVLARDLASRGKPLIGSLASVGSLIVMVVLDLVCIPRWGILGASAACSFAYIAGAVILLREFLRTSQVSLSRTLVIKPNDFRLALQRLAMKPAKRAAL